MGNADEANSIVNLLSLLRLCLLNDELLRICGIIEEDDFYFEGAREMDDVFDDSMYRDLLSWPHKSGLKNSGWWERKGKKFS